MKRTWFERSALWLSIVGYGSLFASLAFAALSAHGLPVWVVVPLGFGAVPLLWLSVRALRSMGRILAFEVLALAVLPIWGSVINEVVASPCRIDSCDDTGIYRPFAVPEFYGLLGLHAIVVLAYVVSRRRPEALPPWPEALIHALLVLGVTADAVAAFQLILLTPYLLILPLTFPLLAPALSCWLFLRELRARLVRRGSEALHADVPGEQSHSRSATLTTLLFGAYALVHALVYGNVSAFARVFTRTCAAPLSLEAVHLLHEKSCHYLCTVAACGHPSLVKPERYGVRGGERIVVNRQLCVANAFEDLLHARFPGTARRLRRTYDRFGLPVSRWIRTPIASDCVYVAMKPLEWAFYLALLLLDLESPERRISRMYR